MDEKQKQLREEILKRWQKSGFTEGLSGSVSEKMKKLFESVSKELSELSKNE